MIRVYDTNALWRHDEIIRIRHMEAEIAEMLKEIERQKEKAVAAMVRLERTKKWLGIIDCLILYRLKPSTIPYVKKKAKWQVEVKSHLKVGFGYKVETPDTAKGWPKGG